MQINKAFNILIVFTLLGCSTPITQNQSMEDKFAELIKKSINDKTLKHTTELKIYSLNILRIDTITSNTLDSQLVTKTLDRFEICNAMADLYLSMSAINARFRTIDKRLKRSELPVPEIKEIDSDVKKAQQYKDFAKYYHLLLDSLNNIRTHNKRFSDTLYQIRSFLKATEKNSSDSINHFGVEYFYITKDDSVLHLSDIESGKLKRLITKSN